jgi:hypothetical protein
MADKKKDDKDNKNLKKDDAQASDGGHHITNGQEQTEYGLVRSQSLVEEMFI